MSHVSQNMSEPNNIDRYMNGECHVFATALHRELGFSYLILVDESELYGDFIPAINHVYAVDGEGNAYDATGRHDVEEVIEGWFDNNVRYQPNIDEIDSEYDLQKYIEKTADGFQKPLSRYDDNDVSIALDLARDVLRGLLVFPSQGAQASEVSEVFPSV